MLYNIGNVSWKGFMDIKEIKSLRKKAKKIHNNIEKHEKYLKLLRYCKQNLDKLNPIIVDVETTGVKRNDEILQVSIINLNGDILFNRYIRPRNVEEWERAYNIHGIDKELVMNEKDISYYRRSIEKILKKHKLIIGYQVYSDVTFFERSKINCNNNVILDISYPFYQLFKNEKVLEDKPIPSLSDCASFFEYNFNAHDSLSDCQATLVCFNNLLKMEENRYSYRYDEDILKYYEDPKKERIRKTKLERLAEDFVEIYQSLSNKIVLDIEATGIREDDEIMQLSIMSIDGEEIFNEYFKPKKEEWEAAMKIHGITPEFVKDKKSIEEYRKEIQSILDKTEYVIGYGIDFDYNLLKRQGFKVDHIIKLDISEYFKYLYRKLLNDVNAKRPKLIECASFYGFKEEKFHDSLVDCLATLYCYNNMYKDLLKVVENK